MLQRAKSELPIPRLFVLFLFSFFFLAIIIVDITSVVDWALKIKYLSVCLIESVRTIACVSIV